jgi:pimeloyl-ACP methyl ester carboxylesterase
VTDRLAGAGYSGFCCSLPVSGNSDGLVQDIHQQITRAKLTPPIVIAHSLAAYACLKYLESYPLTGLVMVCPRVPVGEEVQLHLGTSTAISEVYKIKDSIPNESLILSPDSQSKFCTESVTLEKGKIVVLCCICS